MKFYDPEVRDDDGIGRRHPPVKFEECEEGEWVKREDYEKAISKEGMMHTYHYCIADGYNFSGGMFTCKEQILEPGAYGSIMKSILDADEKVSHINIDEAVLTSLSYLGDDTPEDKGDVSDGYHTFNELYAHRNLLFIAAMKANPKRSWYSEMHHDGSSYYGWFIAGMALPTGDITYHLPNELLPLMKGIASEKMAPDWDGHTSKDVIDRLTEFLKDA